jgi:hypothetical protein
MEAERLRAWQERLAHPMIPWRIGDGRCWALLRRGYFLASSGWGLHIEGMN